MRFFFVTSFVFIVSFSFSQKPVFTSFTPKEGPAGTIVTIQGANFSIDITKNLVFFGLARATVLDATAAVLTVKVPSGSTYQPISVWVNNLVCKSAKPFNLTFNNAGMDFTPASFAGAVSVAGGASIDLADFNNDGKIDIADGGFYQNSINIYKNTTVDSMFSKAYGWSAGFQNPRDVQAADINGDGLTDLLVSRAYDNIVAVYKNTGSNGLVSFNATPTVCGISGFGTNQFVVTDLDNDGKPDVAVIVETANKISVFKNTSGATNISFAPEINIATEVTPWRISATDLNGDGFPELLVNGYNTAASFTLHQNHSSAAGISFTAVTIPATALVSDLVAGDIDGDNAIDIAVSNSVPNTVNLFRNISTDSNINLAPPVIVNTASSPKDIVLGDLNGDGKPELIVNTSFSANLLSVLKNNSLPGTINLAAYTTYNVGSGNFDLALADMNGDGKIDILTGNSQGNFTSISYLQNSLDLQYQQPVSEIFITAINGDWNNPETWVGNLVPPQGAAIVIKHTVVANVNRLCSKLTIDPGGHLIVNSNIDLRVLY